MQDTKTLILPHFLAKVGERESFLQYSRTFLIFLTLTFPDSSSNTHCPSFYKSPFPPCKSVWQVSLATYFYRTKPLYNMACYTELILPFFPAFLPFFLLSSQFNLDGPIKSCIFCDAFPRTPGRMNYTITHVLESP